MKGKIALVTGAASGIGAATVRQLLERGATVWGADREPFQPPDLPEAAAAFRQLAFDVTADAGWREAMKRIRDEAGTLDILVNAAGISRGDGEAAIERSSQAHWRQVMAVNVEGTLLGCQQAMEMMGRRGGAIVNISSTAALAPSPALGAYGASKAAVLQLTKSFAAACAQQGLLIRCNAVLPGMTETPMTAGMSDEYRARWEEQIPARRFASPEEVAVAILFLAGDAASYVNGVALAVDGGMLSRPVVS